MTSPLRPKSLGEILDRTFQIYRERFLQFVSIAAIPALAIVTFELIESYVPSFRAFMHLRRGVASIGFISSTAIYNISFFFVILPYPAYVHLVSSAFWREPSSSRLALRFWRTHWGRYLWIAVLRFAAGLVIPEIAGALLVLTAGAVAFFAGIFKAHEFHLSYALLVFGLPAVGFCILVYWLGFTFSLAFPVTALESIGGFKAMRRSWTLTRGSRARICFTWLAIFISYWVLAWGLEFLLGQLMFFAGRALHIAAEMRSLFQPAVYVLVSAIYVLIAPIYPIAITLFYYDQRIRHEGYDIQRMMDAAGLNPPPADPAFDGARDPASVTAVAPVSVEEAHS